MQNEVPDDSQWKGMAKLKQPIHGKPLVGRVW